MSTSQEYAALVAFDWADQKHAGALQIGNGPREEFELQQTPEAIEAWAAALQQRTEGLVAVALEQTKGALLYALMKYDFLVLYPVNPKQLARFRESMTPSGAKGDPSDARYLLELLRTHREHLRPWHPDDPQTRLIRQLVEDRRNLVDQRTRLMNALKARLKQYFPLALELLSDLGSRLSCNFLLRWSSLAELQQATPEEIGDFYRLAHCFHPTVITERQEKIRQAIPLVTDEVVLHASRLCVRRLVVELQSLIEPLDEYDDQLAELLRQHPDGPVFQSFPGAGAVLAPRLLAAFGSDRSRMTSAQQMQCFSGIAPVKVESGKQRRIHRRWACNKFLRQTFHEFAFQSIRFSAWAHAYYDLMLARGKKRPAALRALAFKWIRILFHCWQTGTHYDEARYFETLYRRQSPLLKFMANPQTPPNIT